MTKKKQTKKSPRKKPTEHNVAKELDDIRKQLEEIRRELARTRPVPFPIPPNNPQPIRPLNPWWPYEQSPRPHWPYRPTEIWCATSRRIG